MYLLGIDIGGTLTKAVVFDYEGREIHVSKVQTPVDVYKDVYHDRDMDLMWERTCQCIKELPGKENIKAIGLTGHGKGLYAYSAYKGIASTDRRAFDVVKGWEKDGTAKKAGDIALQTVIECQPGPLLKWLKDNEAKAYNKIEHIFMAKDYIRFMLTGLARAEITDYSGSCLMDLNKGQYSKDLFSLFGIEEAFEKMPDLVYPTDICGYVTSEASLLTGLPMGTPVCGGMFDIDAVALAMDLLDEDKLAAITGTWSVNEYISKEPVSYDAKTRNSLFILPGYYLIEESSPTSAGNLDWYLEDFFKGVTYKEADALVEGSQISDIYCFPFLYGTNIEGLNKASLIGFNQSHGKQDILRAIYEGVAFSHRLHIEELLKFRKKPKAIRVSGGATNSPVWMQIFADCLGFPCEIIDTKELGTLGAAMAAGISIGIFKDYRECTSKMVTVKKTFYPSQDMKIEYDRKYEKFIRIANVLKEENV